jgi:hypothetical protein
MIIYDSMLILLVHLTSKLIVNGWRAPTSYIPIIYSNSFQNKINDLTLKKKKKKNYYYIWT